MCMCVCVRVPSVAGITPTRDLEKCVVCMWREVQTLKSKIKRDLIAMARYEDEQFRDFT